MSALRGFIRKETWHLLRDRQTLVILVLMPLLQVLLFGFAVRTEVDNIRLAIVDPTPDHRSTELRSRFGATTSFDIVGTVGATAELEPLFASGRVRQAVVFESRFAERIARGEPVVIQLITDATDPNTGSIMQAYAVSVIRQYEAELMQALPRVRIVPQVQMRFNPTLESVFLFVPGLIAFVLTLTSALMTAISITREKETGTMEVLLVSPLRPWQIVVGKVIPYIALGFANVLLVLAAARIVFGVPINGSPALLLAESLLYIVVALALGVLISTMAPSQRVAMMAALAGLMLPTMMLSGFIFPIESMPAPLRALSNIVPARWFVVVVRGIMIKGVGIEHLWRETLILVGMATALLTLSARRLAVRLG
ncbi:MAG: ABC transporter permease [Gemmatimonadales bacterium]|nr:ABC transporter permease [Gemmatimonadales bacterium]